METNTQDKELFEKEKPRWEVITLHRKQTKLEIARKAPREILRHELLYGGKVETTRKGEGGLEQLRAMAKFMNERGMTPKPKIQCLADVGLPALSRKKDAAAVEPEAAPEP
jgi:hypothetical protein